MSCVRAGGSQKSCARGDGVKNSQESCVRAEDSQKSCVRTEGLFPYHVSLPGLRKHELTNIPFEPWCTSCVKGKAQSEPHKRIERIVEDSELPTVQCDYIVLKDTAASDGLKVLSMYVKSFVYGTSTVVESKGAADAFAVTW